MIERFTEETNKKTNNDFVECLVFSEDSGVVMTGNLTDQVEEGKVSFLDFVLNCFNI